MRTHRVVLLEESRLLRDCLATMIGTQPGLSIVGAAGELSAVVRSARERKAHVVLIGLAPLNASTLHTVRQLKGECPAARIVGMGLSAGESDVVGFIRAGICAFVMKDASFDELVATLRSAASGRHVLPAQLTPRLFTGIASDASHVPVSGRTRMTVREGQVVDLIAEGLSNKEIAHELNIATHTVKSHVHNILEKLGVNTRLQVAAAIRAERLAPMPFVD
jgi:two-component system, NarL family, nitrate/nitrite response regulator NarL